MDIVSSLFSIGSKIITALFPDPSEARAAQLELLKLQQSGELEAMAAQANIVVAEAQSESWITRNWRPITMLTFVTIIANNYILAPYLQTFGLPYTILPVPEKMWSLLEIGLGGYILSRGAEKIMREYKK